jgi:MFS family permease
MLRRKDLYALALMFFFWTVFDGIISYSTPIFITQNGLSNTFMGIILASSSLGGALFDFVLAHFMKNTTFRRLFFLMFLVSLIYPFVLFSSKLLIVYIAAMVLWGIYYDLGNFGEYDFIGRRVASVRHADGFGLISVFSSLGYMISPLFAGFIVGSFVTFRVFLFAFVFLFFSFLIYLAFLELSKGKSGVQIETRRGKKLGFLKEMSFWPTIAKEIWPVILFISLINVFDAFFWTIGPSFSQSLEKYGVPGGILLTLYGLPTLMVGWFVGRLTGKFGKKKTAMFAFFLGSLTLSAIYFSSNVIFILTVVFISSFLSALSWPSIKAAIADYISESSFFEGQIEGIVDVATNFGYIIGPIIAGIISDKLGGRFGFAGLGIISAFLTLIIIKVTPRKIKVDVKL